MTLYQAKAWNGEKYTCISVPKRKEHIARREALVILMHPYPECNLTLDVYNHWKEKELIIEEVHYD